MTSPTVTNVSAIHTVGENTRSGTIVFQRLVTSPASSRGSPEIKWRSCGLPWKAIFRGYPQLLRTNAGIRFQIKPSPPSSTFFLNSFSLRRYKPIYLRSLVVTICTTRFDDRKFYVLPLQCIYVFVWISKQTPIISLYSINWLNFITEI